MTDQQLQLGRKINRWTVIETGLIQSHRRYVRVKCDCGTIKVVRERSVANEDSKSCGCLRAETTKCLFTTHGMSNMPEYVVWESMRQRCYDKNCECYPHYGGRGIRVCDRWNDFASFFADMGKRPTDKHSIERIDNECNYFPDNCVWATAEQQGNNKRNNRLLTAFGETHTIRQWSRIKNIDYFTLIWRDNNGWNPERTLTP